MVKNKSTVDQFTKIHKIIDDLESIVWLRDAINHRLKVGRPHLPC